MSSGAATPGEAALLIEIAIERLEVSN